MATKRDYYEILSISKGAAADDIKKAYRQSAMKHHPDRNPGDKKAEELFKEATEAYQVLSDAKKRQVYDQYGHAGLGSQGFDASGFSGGFGDIFEDIFEDFFGGGGGGRRQRAQRGNDLAMAVELTFEEAAFGVERKVDVTREENCVTCDGEGAKPGTHKKTCATCQGSGQVLATSGFFNISRACPKCHGQGALIEQPCSTCRGTGRSAVKRNIQVNVPAGVDTGIRLRMPGQGEGGLRGGPRGDLYIEVHVKEHEVFKRRDEHVILELPIPMVQAALGCDMEVPTLKGMAELKIPAGTQNGKVFKLKGKGFPSLRGHGTGDQEVHIHVETPMHLTPKQNELLKQFAEASGEKVSPATEGFIKKIKSLLNK